MRAIWAQSRDAIIGDGNDMPWNLPEDLKHFKDSTMGSPVLMGRATWESIPEKFRPLPGRENFVISSKTPGTWSNGATVLTTLDDPSIPEDVWVMGGGQIYAATLPHVTHVVRTIIDVELHDALGRAAVFAPQLDDFDVVDESPWQESAKGTIILPHYPHTAGPLRFKFQNLRRRGL